MSVSADLATLAEWRNALWKMGEVYEGMRLCAHGVIDGGGVAGKGWRDAAFWRNAEDVQAKADALAESRGERPFPVFDGFRDALGQFKIFMGKAESIEATPPSPSGPYPPAEQRTRRKAAIVREAIDLAERWAAARGELWGAIPFLEQGQAFLGMGAAMVAEERERLAWIREGMAGIGSGVEDAKRAAFRAETAAKNTLSRVEGVPALVAEAQDARENPEEVAAEVLRFVQTELEGRAGKLWTAWKECGHSLNAAAKRAGIAETTARRIFAREIVPFYQKHKWPLPKESGWGKRNKVRMRDAQLDSELAHGRGEPGT